MQLGNNRTREITDDEFRANFSLAAQDGRAANDFFGAFQYVQELVRGNYSTALHQGIGLLEKCQQLDPATYEIVHKGTPFYWLGTAAFLVHDYQSALFFYDTAVSEDLRAGAHPVNNSTPGLRFIQIEGEQPAQAARGLMDPPGTPNRRYRNNYGKNVLGLENCFE